MNGEILIKARKVFVEDNIVENSEECPHCKSKGLQKKLRYFFLSLEEKIYKCENGTCLYPFERFMFKSLIDHSVYYYEEVVDDGRELFFRVPIDGQNDCSLSNPLSTQLFCDNQRNPLIEDYNCDFSDLFNDIDSDVELAQAKLPTSTENPDALEFLDEINNISASHGTNANANEIDSIIDEILNESPVKCNPLPSSSTKQPHKSTPKEQPKLLKCIQHLDKVKKAQSRKTSEQSKHPFTTAILKARKNQTKLQGDPASTNQESECLQTLQQKPKKISKPSATAGFLKSANNLRPVELARRLSNLKSIQTNSQFLRQYMKTKEEKLFADELKPENVNQVESGPEKTVATCSNFTKPNQNILSVPDVKTMEQPISSTVPKETNPIKKPSARKSVKKEPSIAASIQNDCETKKKERKPRSKKQNNIVNDTIGIGIDIKKEHQNDTVATATKKVAATRRKPVKVNQAAESCSTNGEQLHQNQTTAIKTEPRKNSRKRKKASAEADDTKGKSENVGPAKRQRKSKCDSEGKTDESKGDEIKPKRSRATKSKVNPVKVEQPSLPLLLNSDAIDCQIIDENVRPESSEENKRNLEAEVKTEKFAMPSTFQINSTIETIDEHSTANVLAYADLDESIPYFTVKVTVNPTENTNEPQPTSAAKRQRKPRTKSNVIKTEQIHSVENKPKRSRSTKSKANLTEIEQPTLAPLLNDDEIDSRTSVSGTSTIYPEPSSSQQKVSAQKAKRQLTDVKIKHMNVEKIGHCSSFKEMDPTMVTIVHNEANELTVIVAADESMPTNELNSCLTAEAVQYESSDTKDSNVCISKSENVGPAKRQRKSKCGGDAKAVQNVSVENKPKRSRATRSKANSINIEQPPLASQTNYDATDSQAKYNIKDEWNATDTNVYTAPNTIHTDEIEAWHTVEIVQSESTDVHSSNVYIDVCEIENDSISISSSENKEEKINEGCSTSPVILAPNKGIDFKTEPKKNSRKRKVTSVDEHEPKSTAKKKNSEKVGPVKRQRKSKCDSDAKTDQIKSVEVKPKRSRAVKSKASPTKNQQSSTSLPSDDVTDTQEKSGKEESNMWPEGTKREKSGRSPSKRQTEYTLEPKVKEETCEKPSTSQMNPTVDCCAANDLISTLIADSEPIEQESASAESRNMCDDNVCIANSDEQQFTSADVLSSSQLIQPKLEQMDNDAAAGSDNDQNRKQKLNEATDPYYRRKVFKKEKESSFQVDKLLGEWDESDCEQQRSQTGKDTPNSSETHDMDTISIASGTSDSEFGFVGSPYRINE